MHAELTKLSTIPHAVKIKAKVDNSGSLYKRLKSFTTHSRVYRRVIPRERDKLLGFLNNSLSGSEKFLIRYSMRAPFYMWNYETD